MLSPLSILSLDQGPKWREPAPEPEKEAPEAVPGRLQVLWSLVAGLSWSLAPRRSRA